MEERKLKKPLTGALIGLVFGLGIIVIASILVFLSHNNSNNTTGNSQVEIPPINVNAEQLIQDYTSNQISANEKYQNKIVLVDGMIYEVGQDWSGGNYVMLRNDYEYNGVQCEFKTKDALMNLYKGQYITLKGKVIGFTKGLVLIDSCSVTA